ncbi:MAG: hypothetical protein IJI66_05750 [Erysipelotrichaceae bacterium]|nr:hypothetical protein [Erysipelotrichaceae bacterium]
MAGCSSNNSDNKNPVTKQEEKKETSYTLKPSSSSSKTDIETKPKNSSDPYNLSFTDSSLLFDSDLRNILSRSELEYCSYVIEDVRSSNVTLTWNLKSNDKEVYRCDYSFDKNRSYSERSVIACKISEAYEKYKNGDTALIRDYVMPEKNDDIDMFINENSSSYYEKYFILGKYSDMYCYTKGDDIYFEYYWYQNTDEGPALVYKSTAENTDTTSGQRYRNDLWELFELSYRNIDIIPYNEYPRTKDYYEVYRDWKNKDRDRKEKENLKEMIDIYCECGDEDELYSEYEDDFDSWEEAADFWEEHCD